MTARVTTAQHRRTAVGELSVVQAGGDGARGTVLLLNALGLEAAEWGPHVDALVAHGHRVVAIDRRGHGRTPYRPLGRFDDLVDDVVAVLDALGLDRVDVCGVSMGGTEALGLVAVHPERVDRLVLVDTFAELDEATAHARLAGMRALLDEHGMPGLAQGVVDGMLHVDLPAAHRRRLVDAFVAMGEHAFFGLMAVLYRAGLGEGLSRIRRPTLVLSATHDTRTPPAAMRALAAAIPGARFGELPGAGHFPHLEVPERFAGALLDFLDTDSTEDQR